MAKIIGLKSASFPDKVTGEVISFGRVYVTYPDDTVNGLSCEELKLNPSKFVDFKLGDEVRINRNKTGKVESLELANCFTK